MPFLVSLTVTVKLPSVPLWLVSLPATAGTTSLTVISLLLAVMSPFRIFPAAHVESAVCVFASVMETVRLFGSVSIRV